MDAPDPVSPGVADALETRRTPWWAWVAVSALVACHLILSLGSASRTCETFDEPAYIVGGLTYWKLGAFTLNAEAGVLPQRVAVLPLLALGPDYPFDAREPPFGPGWDQADELLHARGNDAVRIVWWARCGASVFGAAIVLVVFFWSRSVWGVEGGLLSASLGAFSPTLLAHGPLVTSDSAAALFFTLATWWLWSCLSRVTPWTVLVAGLASGGLLASKMSGVLVVPIAGVLLAARTALGGGLEIRVFTFRRRLTGRWEMAAAGFAAILAAALIAWVTLWGCYSFRSSAVPPPAVSFSSEHWETALSRAGAAAPFVDAARQLRLFPEAYLFGLSYTFSTADVRAAFMDGRYSAFGWASFFPYVWSLKTSPAEFAALAACVACLAWRLRARGSVLGVAGSVTPVVVLLVVYWLTAITSHLNIGHRHLLPTYPAMFVLCGAAARWPARGKAGAWLAALIAAGQGAVAGAAWPHYIAYFNPLQGGPSRAYRHLVDSSLDWGQELPALSAWIYRRAGELPVYLSYFGSARPESRGVRATALPSYLDRRTEAPARLEPGLYCISATMLIPAFFPMGGPWCAQYESEYQRLRSTAAPSASGFAGMVPIPPGSDMWQYDWARFRRLTALLRKREPEYSIGYSILIYNVSERELDEALNGPAPELVENGFKRSRR